MADVGVDQFSTPELRVGLLGRFEVAGTSGPLPLPVGKATTIVKLLVVRRRSFVPVDEIADILWDEDPPMGAAQNIASLVSRVRRVLGPERIVGGRSGYRFEAAGCWVDVDEAERLAREAEVQLRSGRPALAAAASAQARQLFQRGRFLEDEPYALWASEGRRDAERIARRVSRAGWTAALALGEYRQALEVAERAIDADALDEEAHRSAMQALYLAGDAGAALVAYQRVRDTLVEELGADPSPETEALYLSILRSEPLPQAAAGADTADRAPSPSTRLAGRDRELSLLVEAWAAAAGGRPGVVAVSGAAGSGKTRLVGEAAGQAVAAGAAVLQAGCHAAERSLFLQPVLEALRGYLHTLTPGRVHELAGPWTGTLTELIPELRSIVAVEGYERVTPELEHRRSLEAVAHIPLRLSRERPVLIVLDDLHQAGQSTLEALHFLVDRLTDEPILLLGTVASDRAQDVLPLLGGEVVELALGPLSPAAVEELVRRFDARDVDALELYERTGGHPQFVVEALRLAAGGGGDGARQPESLRNAVEERVARAGRDVEELLRVAAVVGTSFDLDFVAELADIGIGDAVRRGEQALRAGLLEPDGTRFRFAGGIIGDVLYETTPLPIRTSHHRRAAARLGDRPEAAAVHHAAVGDWARAHEAWSAAAEQAIRAFALRDAERLLSEAVSSAQRAGDAAALARSRLRRGQLKEELADYAGARDDHTAALETARQLGDDALEAQALERLGWTAYYGRDSAVAAELAARATELAESAAAAPAALPSALVLVGRIRHWAGDIEGAAEAYEAALERDPDPATTASALSCLGALLEHGDRFAEARRTLDKAAAESTRTGAFRPLLRTLFFAGLARGNLGDFGGALRALERKRRLLEEYDVHFYRARTDTLLSWVWREVGDLGRARDLAGQAVAEAREVKAGSLQVEQELHGLLGVAECAALAGDLDAAAAMVEEAHPLLSTWLPFKWRADLRYRDVRCRVFSEEADELLELSRERRSRKYEALALAHLGRHEEAAVAAKATGSDLLLAEVAPAAEAHAAFDRLAAALPSELRDGFVTRGRLVRVLAARRDLAPCAQPHRHDGQGNGPEPNHTGHQPAEREGDHHPAEGLDAGQGHSLLPGLGHVHAEQGQRAGDHGRGEDVAAQAGGDTLHPHGADARGAHDGLGEERRGVPVGDQGDTHYQEHGEQHGLGGEVAGRPAEGSAPPMRPAAPAREDGAHESPEDYRPQAGVGAGVQQEDGVKASENNITPFTLTMLGLPVSHDLTNLIYDTLFWSQVKADPEPWLAESAEPSNDYRSWTVKLRPGVTWHDGRPVTADDVAFTFEKMKSTTGGRYSHHVWEYPVFERAEVLDPLTVRLNFADKAPTFKILPGADLPIVPKHIWEGIANPTQATDILPVGSGPYKMTSFVPGQIYRLEANSNYFKGRPKVDAIDLPIVRDQSAAFAAMQTGQVDTVDRVVPPELYEQMSSQRGIKVVEATRKESVHLHFNNRKAPLTDARLRNAVTDAIDNDAIVQTVLLGRGRPGRDGWVHPDSAWADPQGGHVFDVAGANKALDDAGYRRGEDGIRRTPDGNRVEFNLSVAANEPQHQRSAQLISQQVEAIGVKINVESVDAATLRQRRNTGNIDSFITNLESHAHADPDALYFFFHSPAANTPSTIFGAYSNPQFDRLVEQARSTVDNAERNRLLVEAQRIYAQDSPALVLYYPNGDYAYRTAAYDGWIADTGHGILTKRSFIPGYEAAGDEPALTGSATEDGPPWAAVGVLLGLAVVGGGVLAARSRRREEYEAEEA